MIWGQSFFIRLLKYLHSTAIQNFGIFFLFSFESQVIKLYQFLGIRSDTDGLICQFRYFFISRNFLMLYIQILFLLNWLDSFCKSLSYLYDGSFLSGLNVYYFLSNCFDCQSFVCIHCNYLKSFFYVIISMLKHIYYVLYFSYFSLL